MQNNPIFAKKIYVPTSAKPKPAAPRALLPEELRLKRAGAVFRSIAWDGVAVVEVVLAPPAEALDLLSPARLVFARIPWTGEVRPPPTEQQALRSVGRVLGLFKWEQ
jgi:hypothetical protein